MSPAQDIIRGVAIAELEEISLIATRNQLRAPTEVLPALQAIVERAERALHHLRRMEAL